MAGADGHTHLYQDSPPPPPPPRPSAEVIVLEAVLDPAVDDEGLIEMPCDSVVRLAADVGALDCVTNKWVVSHTDSSRKRLGQTAQARPTRAWPKIWVVSV